MKTVTGIVLMLVRVYCMSKILIWLVQQNFSTNHPLNEIEIYLVYLLLDIWIILISKQISEEN